MWHSKISLLKDVLEGLIPGRAHLVPRDGRELVPFTYINFKIYATQKNFQNNIKMWFW